MYPILVKRNSCLFGSRKLRQIVSQACGERQNNCLTEKVVERQKEGGGGRARGLEVGREGEKRERERERERVSLIIRDSLSYTHINI